jgi:hypothetical protein
VPEMFPVSVWQTTADALAGPAKARLAAMMGAASAGTIRSRTNLERFMYPPMRFPRPQDTSAGSCGFLSVGHVMHSIIVKCDYYRWVSSMSRT